MAKGRLIQKIGTALRPVIGGPIALIKRVHHIRESWQVRDCKLNTP
jgi:hypothetical protein